MPEPTYSTPQHLLDAVETAANLVNRDRDRLRNSAGQLHYAVAQAAIAGASEDILVAYGVDRGFARQAIGEAMIEVA